MTTWNPPNRPLGMCELAKRSSEEVWEFHFAVHPQTRYCVGWAPAYSPANPAPTGRASWFEGVVDSVGSPAYHESLDEEVREIATELLDWLEPLISADAVQAERERIAAWLTAEVTVKPCGPGHAGHVGIVTLLDALDRIRKGDFS